MTRNLIERAAWTAAEAALTVLTAAGLGFVDIAAWKAAALAAGAAAISALKTAVQEHRGNTPVDRPDVLGFDDDLSGL